MARVGIGSVPCFFAARGMQDSFHKRWISGHASRQTGAHPGGHEVSESWNRLLVMPKASRCDRLSGKSLEWQVVGRSFWQAALPMMLNCGFPVHVIALAVGSG